ncbi:HNH endonuclease [Microtetraspora niveoalba]|uniref:HNH endonuclease n=1 Tax=Microtetraspora niveoalba TaxID=46175 RepID=UPI000A01ED03
MPVSPPSRCTAPQSPPCPALAERDGRCGDHQRKPWQGKQGAWAGGSTRRWRRVRGQHLRAEPTCRRCGAPADEVDHIVRLEDGGARFDHRNLQSLCAPCHQLKSAEDHRSARARAQR